MPVMFETIYRNWVFIPELIEEINSKLQVKAK